MTTYEELPKLDYRNPNIFGVNSYMRALQAEGPIIKVRTDANDAAWLVTRHKQVNDLLIDRRLGRTHPDPDNAPRFLDNPMLDLPRTSVDFTNEREIHLRMRRHLAPYFAGSYIATIESRISVNIHDWVEVLAQKGPPVDMQTEFAQPMTMQMLCELLGVPQSERESFPELVRQAFSLADVANATSSNEVVYGYFRGLAARKRADPGEDIMSALASAGLDDQEITEMAVMLLYAAYGSTSNNLALGIARLCTDPQLREELVNNPDRMPDAVEECLRTASSGGFILPHYAREDIELNDVTIRKGDLVLLDYALANFDEEVFPEPDRFDIDRNPNPHMTFSHGIWFCIGARLARSQFRIAFNALLSHFPNMRLAVPLSEVGRSAEHMGGEVGNLMVTW